MVPIEYHGDIPRNHNETIYSSHYTRMLMNIYSIRSSLGTLMPMTIASPGVRAKLAPFTRSYVRSAEFAQSQLQNSVPDSSPQSDRSPESLPLPPRRGMADSFPGARQLRGRRCMAGAICDAVCEHSECKLP